MDLLKPLASAPGTGKPRAKKKSASARETVVKLKVSAPTPKVVHEVMDRFGVAPLKPGSRQRGRP